MAGAEAQERQQFDATPGVVRVEAFEHPIDPRRRADLRQERVQLVLDRFAFDQARLEPEGGDGRALMRGREDSAPEPMSELTANALVGVRKDVKPTRQEHEDDGVRDERVTRDARPWLLGCVWRRLEKSYRPCQRLRGVGDIHELSRSLLAESFEADMGKAFTGVAPASRPATPTLSVGLAVVHHLRPMRDALDTARRAEKTAKTLRNALAIHVDKRSGGELVVKGSWSPEDGVLPLDRRIPMWARTFHGEQLPDKVAFALEEAVSLWVDAPGAKAPSDDTIAMIRALALRALGRRRGERGAEEIDEDLRKVLGARIGKATPAEDVRQLSAELQIARLFHDAYEEAWGDEAFAGLDADLPEEER